MSAITAAIGDVLTLVTTMLDTIIANPILVVLFSSGFIALGLRVLRQIMRTSKRA